MQHLNMSERADAGTPTRSDESSAEISNPILDRLTYSHQQSDGAWLAYCPAHDDTKPSLVVSLSDDHKILLKCRAQCATRDVVAAVGGSMADLFDVVTPEGWFDVVAARPSSPSQASLVGLRAKARMFADQFSSVEFVAARHGLGAGDAERLMLGTVTDSVEPRLSVPFRDIDGDVIGMQYRALRPDSSLRWTSEPNPSGESWSRIGFFPGARADVVVVTEGPSDALTAVGAGYSAIAVRGAGMLDKASAELIAEWVGGGVAVVAADGDSAGLRFENTVTDLLSKTDVDLMKVSAPDGGDLTDVFADGGADAVRSLLDARKPVTVVPVRDAVDFPFTDVGNAQLAVSLLRQSGEALRFAPGMGWLLYKHGAWVPDALNFKRVVIRMVGESTTALADEARLEWGRLDTRKREIQRLWKDAEASNDQAELVRLSDEASDVSRQLSDAAGVMNSASRAAKYCNSSQGIDNMLKEFASEPSIATSIDDLDQHDDLLLVNNGVVNLQTGELAPFDPDLLMTRRVPVDYDPNATAPRWSRFLDEVMNGDTAMVDYLQRLIGYGITGSIAEQCFVIHYGTGANGKSVFMDTLAEVFGGIHQKAASSSFLKSSSERIQNDIAALRGARLVTAAETDSDSEIAEALLKTVTGEQQITARFLRQEFFTYRPTYLIQLATNHKPQIRSQDHGLWRRIKMVNWSRTFTAEEQDRDLLKALRSEAEGILAWAVAGAVAYNTDGLRDPDSIVDATADYRQESDELHGFLPGVFVKDPNAGNVKAKDIMRKYQEWCEAEGNRFPVGSRRLYQLLVERGVEKHSLHSGVVFSGIRRMRPSDVREEAAA